MAPRGRGTILFTGATASVRGSGFAAFAAAKFGLRGVAQSMARELAPKNIHVAHLIIDGAIDSEAIHPRLTAVPTGVVGCRNQPDVARPLGIARARSRLRVPADPAAHRRDPDTRVHRIQPKAEDPVAAGRGFHHR